ncbi:MAG: type II toxin-antitoxin system VapC family toxin [Methanobrevibacter sp.]|nr:type II toxin-antitoxin system VapC family toxin [Methanobrevibacter sp.]
MKIYLDTCCYNRPFDDQNQVKIELESTAKLYIQNKIYEGEYDLVWSFMLDYENNDNPYEDRRENIQIWENIATEFCDLAREVLEQGKKLQKLGIKENDALHMSCAIFTKCSYFLTTDYKLTNRDLDKIKIVNPIEFIKIME